MFNVNNVLITGDEHFQLKFEWTQLTSRHFREMFSLAMEKRFDMECVLFFCDRWGACQDGFGSCHWRVFATFL